MSSSTTTASLLHPSLPQRVVWRRCLGQNCHQHGHQSAACMLCWAQARRCYSRDLYKLPLLPLKRTRTSCLTGNFVKLGMVFLILFYRHFVTGFKYFKSDLSAWSLLFHCFLYFSATSDAEKMASKEGLGENFSVFPSSNQPITSTLPDDQQKNVVKTRDESPKWNP